MRDGLRSSGNLCAKNEKVEVSPSELMIKRDGEGDLSDENDVSVSEGDASVSIQKREIGRCGSGEDRIGENVDNRRKRSRIDCEGESGDDGGVEKKNKVKEDVDSKVEVVVRVLRSRPVIRTEGGKGAELGENKGHVTGKRVRWNDGYEGKRVEVKNEVGGHSDDENQSDNEVRGKLKRKRGRPRKSLEESDGSVKKIIGVKKEEDDQSSGKENGAPENEGKEKLKSKCGRAQQNDGVVKERIEVGKEASEHFANEGGDQSDNEVKKNVKRKRGRPPKAREIDGSGKKKVALKKEDVDQSVGAECDQSDKEAGKKLKPRRGRPPKVHGTDGHGKTKIEAKKEESNQSSGEISDKPGKPRDKLTPRRGRPPKAQVSERFVKERAEVTKVNSFQTAGEDNDESFEKLRKKLKLKRGRPPKLSKGIKMSGLRKHQGGLKSGNKFLGKESEVKMVTLARKIRCSNDVIEGREAKPKAREVGRSAQRQAVRDKIVELLLGAGWTIEYRPRNGREYHDAVYVNPEGRTHWSITLAYRVLKRGYEDGGGDSKECKAGFKFVPLPDEELSILTKVMSKQRCDKNKKKKWKQVEKGGKEGEGVTKNKKQKQKLHKRKSVHQTGKLDESVGASYKEVALSVRDENRLKTNGRKRFALMVRNSKEGAESDCDGYVLYNGQRTVLAWMVDLGAVPLDGKVQYAKRRKTQTMLRGRITIDGIQCDCCSKTFTTSEFEIHAGSKSCHPLKNIYLETGPSLLQCQLDSWHKQDESARGGFHLVDTGGEDPNDDTCGICGDGGDLICCDGCPSTFHQSCLEIKKFPSGIWHCIYCSCKFCGMVGGNLCQNNVDNAAAVVPALLTCYLCEEKYHQSCLQAKDAMNDVSGRSFCGKNCQELYDSAQMLLGTKLELEEGFSWTLVRRFDVGSDVSLGGMPGKVECNSKVAVASLVMDECFLPMVDHRSGVNLIRNVVYNFGSNFNSLNYSGFLTAILERGDEIISAASIRIHGNHLAEMPFIGTRHMYRRQGMCRRLLTAIETALCSLKVEKLVIPAISELRETWTSVFGFKPVDGLSKQKMKKMNMMVFPGVDMLQKPLLKPPSAEKTMIPAEGLKCTKPKEHQTMDEMLTNLEEQRSAGFDLNFSSENTVPHDGMRNCQPVAIESGSLPPDDRLNGTSDFTSENANLTICLTDKKCIGQSSVVCDELDEGSKGIVNPLNYLGDMREHQNGEVIEHQNAAVSSSIVLPADETMLDMDASLIHHNVSDRDSRLSVSSHNASDANRGWQFSCASRACAKTAHCEMKIEHGHVKCDLNPPADDVIHTILKISTTKPCELTSAHGLEVSDKNAVHSGSNTSNLAHDLVQPTLLAIYTRSMDAVNGDCAVLPVDDISLPHKGTGPDAHEVEGDLTIDDANCSTSQVTDFDVAKESSLQACIGNGIRMLAAFRTSSCVVDVGGVHELKELSTSVQPDALSLGAGLASQKQADSDLVGNHTCVSHHKSEPLCNSSPASGVSLHCASGGNSCGAPEVIILSNQAS